MNIGTKIGAGFAAGMVIILAIGASAYVSTQRLVEANRWVTHTHQVIEGLQRVQRLLDDAETGERGFVLIGEERYLEPYDAAAGEIQPDIDALVELTGDNAAQQESLRQVRKLADAKLAQLRHTIQVRRQSGQQAAVEVILTDRGEKIMDELRGVVAEMKGREQQLLEERNDAANAAADRTTFTITVWMPIALLVLGVAAVVLMRTVRFGGPAAPPSARRKKWGRIAVHYLFAVAVVAVAVLLRWRLEQSFGPLPTYITFYPAVLLAVAIGGGGPGILATVLSALAADYFFMAPIYSFRIDAPNDILALGIFTGINLCLCAMAERFRRAQWAEAISVAQERQLDVLSRLNEELSQQSEELSQQSEELARQNEELQTQSEEIQTLNSELTHREDILHVLLDAACLGTAEQAVMQDICQAAKEMFGPAADAVIVVEPENGRLAVHGHAGLGPEAAKVESWPAENRFAKMVITENKTAALADSSLRPDIALIELPGEEPFRAMLAAPMRIEGRPFGVVGVYSRHPQEWTAEQFRLAEWLAAQCSRIVETLRLQEALRSVAQFPNENPCPVLRIDRAGTVLYVNKSSAVLGSQWQCEIGRPASEPLAGLVRETLDRRQAKEMDLESGDRVFSFLLVPVAESGYVNLYGHDVTDRKRAEEQLARLAEIVESSDEAILSKDVHGIIQTWNAGAERLFGYRAEEVIGQPIALLLPPERIQEEEQILQRLLSGQRVERLETIRVTKDGRRLDVLVTASPVKDHDGRIVGASKIIHDIGDRKRAEEALRRTAEDLVRSNKDLEQFAYVASHDLKEPLRMVTGFMSLLKDRCQGKLDAKSDDYIAFAADGAARMQGLIDDLLAYSRAGRGEISERTDSGAVLDRVLGSLTVSIQESGAAITRDPLPTIACNPVELTHVFQNLIGNALKFKGRRKPEIHVAARRQAGGWLFTVRDNGIGIDPQFAERIFMIFQRLHTRDDYPGTGIGLAICKKIVERYGGRIWVESQPEKGSTFCFTIPDRGKGQG